MYDPRDLAKSLHQILFISILRLGCYPSATLNESTGLSLFSEVHLLEAGRLRGRTDTDTHGERCSASRGKSLEVQFATGRCDSVNSMIVTWDRDKTGGHLLQKIPPGDGFSYRSIDFVFSSVCLYMERALFGEYVHRTFGRVILSRGILINGTHALATS